MPAPDGVLRFERIAIEGGERQGRTSYNCFIKSLHNGKVIELTALVELPYSDKKLSEIEHEIAQAIHEATNPARLNRLPS